MVDTTKYGAGFCTCECPDGPGEHLENCESYLIYWEADKLNEITDEARLIRRKGNSTKLYAQLILEFVRLTQDNADITDPQQLIFAAIDRARPGYPDTNRTLAGRSWASSQRF